MSEANNKNIQEIMELTSFSSFYKYMETAKEKLISDIDILLRAEYALIVGSLDYYLHQIRLERIVNILAGEESSLESSLEILPKSIAESIKSEDDIWKRKDILEKYLGDTIWGVPFLSEKGVDETAHFLGISNLWEIASGKVGVSVKEFKEIFNDVVNRRNKIVHQMDNNKLTGSKNPITIRDVKRARNVIRSIISSIEESISDS